MEMSRDILLSGVYIALSVWQKPTRSLMLFGYKAQATKIGSITKGVI